MVLSNKQKKDLDRAVLEYLSSQGYSRAKQAFETESGESEPADNGTLEKKWTTVIRLQRKVKELEEQVKQANNLVADVRSGSESGALSRTLTAASNALPKPPKRNEMTGHQAAITCLAVHPVFTIVASGSGDGTVKMWDYERATFDCSLTGHVNTVDAVAFNHSGDMLSTGSADLTIRLWKRGAGEGTGYGAAATLRGHAEPVTALVFSKDDDCLFSASRDATIKVWNVATSECSGTWHGHDAWIRSIDVNSAGTHLVSCGNDKTVRVWDIARGVCTSVISEHSQVVESVKFAPESLALDNLSKQGDVVVSVGRDSTVRAFNASNGSQLMCLEGHQGWVRGVFVHPKSPFILSCGDDKTIKIWDMNLQRCVRTISDAHNQAATTLVMDGWCSVLLSGGCDNAINVWQCK